MRDPKNVKDTIALAEWSTSRRYNAAKAYTTFLRIQGQKWQKPHYNPVSKFPFIPQNKKSTVSYQDEDEVSALSCNCSKKRAHEPEKQCGFNGLTWTWSTIL